MRVRTMLLGGALFLGGFGAGAFAMDWLAMEARPTERWALRLSMQREQEARARRAARAGQLVKSLVHRWNAVALEADDGLEILGSWEDVYAERFQPLGLLAAKWEVNRNIPREKRARANDMYESLLRNDLASTLEALGHSQMANAEADRAVELIRSCSKCKDWDPATFAELLERESSEPYLLAERYYIDGEEIR